MKTNEMKWYFVHSLKCVCMRLLSDTREMRVGPTVGLKFELEYDNMISPSFEQTSAKHLQTSAVQILHFFQAKLVSPVKSARVRKD